MKFESVRSSLVGSTIALIAALTLASCGGGGAGSPGPQGGPPQIQPAVGTFYSGVQYTITIAGGRPPYTLGSSEPALFSVPQTLDGHTFTVIPANTGVIDVGQQPGQLPTRQVILTMRDSVGSTASAEYDVAMNFMTGYGVFYTSNCASEAVACSGGETNVTLDATINGLLTPLRTYRLDILRGPFFWLFPSGQVAGQSITVTTDHQGNANAIFQVNQNVQTQIGVYRITDLATGASVEQIFVIDGIDIPAELAVIPDAFTFTGPFSTTCGTGSADFLVFDGTPPYTAISSFPGVLVTPSSTSSQPGRFTLTVGDASTCLDEATIVVTDANLARAEVTVTTLPGSGDPPPPPLSITPTGLTLGCGDSGSVTAVGGEDSISAASPTGDLTVVVAGRTITVTRNGADPPIPDPNPGQNTNVVVTDGTSNVTLRINHPTACS